MGKADIHVTDFFEDNQIFADMVNAYYCNGKQVIKPEFLKEANKELTYVTSHFSKRMIRDSVKRYFSNVLICIYVLEHQQNIDYHMVLRDLQTVAMEYYRQWKEKQKQHLQQKDLEAGAEFISGMKKDEKFIPVLSLVVYYGPEKWDAAKSLHELLELKDIPPELHKYISDHQIHVFDYHDYEEFDAFHSELKQIFQFLKNYPNKIQLQKMVAEHKEEYYNISKEAYGLIAAVTGSKVLLSLEDHENEEKGEINMYDTLEEIRLDGVKEGIEALILDYLEEGFSEEKILTKLQKRFSLSKEQALEYFKKYALEAVQ